LPCAATQASTSVDAELLALAAEFAECDPRMVALGAAGAPDGVWESAGRDMHDRWWEIVNRVIDLPAHTQSGRAAEASIVPAVIRDVGDEDTPDHKLVLSLVRDLTGQAGPGTDAELVRLCDRLVAIEIEEEDLQDRIADDDERDVLREPLTAEYEARRGPDPGHRDGMKPGSCPQSPQTSPALGREHNRHPCRHTAGRPAVHCSARFARQLLCSSAPMQARLRALRRPEKDAAGPARRQSDGRAAALRPSAGPSDHRKPARRIWFQDTASPD